jgi:hypothetical protein
MYWVSIYGIPTQVPYKILIFATHVTCPSHFTFLSPVTLIIPRNKQKLCSFSIICSILGSNIPINLLFWKSCTVFSHRDKNTLQTAAFCDSPHSAESSSFLRKLCSGFKSQFGMKNMGLRDKRFLRYGCDNDVAFAASGESTMWWQWCTCV